MRGIALGVAPLAALLINPAAAGAEPAAPQPGAPCPNLADVMTWPPQDKTPLVCQGPAWQQVTTPYPISDRWLSYGPAMKLHGDGLRNASIRSGNWTATPQDADAQCRAEQITVVDAGVVGAPLVDEGAKGQPLSFTVLPKLFSITMSGHCLWTRESDG